MSRASRSRRPAPASRPVTPRAKKISITVDERVLAEVQKDAARAGRTLSGYVTEALARDLRRQRLRAIVEAYESEHGTITDAELARARAKWQG